MIQQHPDRRAGTHRGGDGGHRPPAGNHPHALALPRALQVPGHEVVTGRLADAVRGPPPHPDDGRAAGLPEAHMGGDHDGTARALEHIQRLRAGLDLVVVAEAPAHHVAVDAHRHQRDPQQVPPGLAHEPVHLGVGRQGQRRSNVVVSRAGVPPVQGAPRAGQRRHQATLERPREAQGALLRRPHEHLQRTVLGAVKAALLERRYRHRPVRARRFEPNAIELVDALQRRLRDR